MPFNDLIKALYLSSLWDSPCAVPDVMNLETFSDYKVGIWGEASFPNEEGSAIPHTALPGCRVFPLSAQDRCGHEMASFPREVVKVDTIMEALASSFEPWWGNKEKLSWSTVAPSNPATPGETLYTGISLSQEKLFVPLKKWRKKPGCMPI